MKKIGILLLTLCVLALCLPLTANAELPAPKINFDTTKQYTAGQEVTFTVSALGQDDIKVRVYRNGNYYFNQWMDTTYDVSQLSQATISDTELTATVTLQLKAGTNYIEAYGDHWNNEDQFITERTETARSAAFVVVANETLAAPSVAFEAGKKYTTLDNQANFTVKGLPDTKIYMTLKKGNETLDNYSAYTESDGSYTDSFGLYDGPGDYYIEVYQEDAEGNNISPTVRSAPVAVTAGQLKEPSIWVSGEKLLFAEERLRVRFNANAEQSIQNRMVAVKYTVTRDSDNADMSIMPRAIERTVTLGNTYDITDGLTAGIYTISAKIVDTNGWYIDSPAATKKVTVTSNILPKLALNKEEGDYRIGDVVNVTITAPGHNAVEVEYYDETIKAYNTKTIALTNGSAIYTSAPLADGIWRDFTVKKADDMSITNVSVEYGASIPEPVITLDKEDYLVGDTARITLTGESAEHFTVRLYCYYDDTDESRTLLNEINYAAVNGQVVIDLPFTERGHFSVDVTSYNETYQVYSYYSAYEYVDVYAPEDAPIDLAEPAGIKILPASKGLTISWNAVPGAQTYSVYRSVGGKKFERVVDKLTVTSFTDTTVPANKVVLYKIRASASNGSGSYYNESDIKSYMLLAQAKKPTAKSKTAKTMDLSWKKVKNADSYEIYYATNKKAPTPTTKATKTAKELKLSVKKLKGGKTYYVYVRAVKKLDDGTKVVGPWSKAAKIKIKKK